MGASKGFSMDGVADPIFSRPNNSGLATRDWEYGNLNSNSIHDVVSRTRETIHGVVLSILYPSSSPTEYAVAGNS